MSRSPNDVAVVDQRLARVQPGSKTRKVSSASNSPACLVRLPIVMRPSLETGSHSVVGCHSKRAGHQGRVAEAAIRRRRTAGHYR